MGNDGIGFGCGYEVEDFGVVYFYVVVVVEYFQYWLCQVLCILVDYEVGVVGFQFDDGIYWIDVEGFDEGQEYGVVEVVGLGCYVGNCFGWVLGMFVGMV